MTAPAFVDTNIWFYALSTNDEVKRIASNALIDSLGTPMINGQVVREDQEFPKFCSIIT